MQKDFLYHSDIYDTDDDTYNVDCLGSPDLSDLVIEKRQMPTAMVSPDDGPQAYALSICVLEGLDKSIYTDGPVTVHITTSDGKLPSGDRFKCDVFTDSLYPMCTSRDDCTVERNGCELTYELTCRSIWLPGSYLLFVRDHRQRLVQLPFRLDEHLQTTFGEPVICRSCSTEDVVIDMLATNEIWCHLAQLPGWGQMRQKMIQSNLLNVYNELRKELFGHPIGSNGNFLICTRNGDLTENDLREFRSQVVPEHPFEYVDCSTLYDAACNNPFEHLGELLSILSDHVICLTNLGALSGTGGKIIVRRLLDRVCCPGSKHLLWLCGSRQEINGLLEMFPSMKDLFSSESWIEQEAYTAFELVQAFFQSISDEHMLPSMAFKEALVGAILKGYAEGSLTSMTLCDVRRIVTDDIRPRYTRRAVSEFDFDQLPLLIPADLDLSLFTGDGSTFEACMHELQEMVGLDDVKRGIATMANNSRFYLERRRRHLPTSGQVAYHCIFTGNPGTGKTTVARKLGRIYHSLGLLSRGEVMAVDRTRLVGRYIGETEENMKAVLEEARGNVLFIDEAYTLYDGASDRKDFGARVIDSLLTVLSQPDPDLLVVFAGYEKEMDAMLNTNPGLSGRFPYKYRFADYDAAQLYEIVIRLFQRDAYILTDEAATELRCCIAQTVSQRTSNFGNARWAEQFVRNGILPAMADRLAQTAGDDYQHIEADDIRRAYEKFNPKATELKPRQKVGFAA